MVPPSGVLMSEDGKADRRIVRRRIKYPSARLLQFALAAAGPRPFDKAYRSLADTAECSDRRC